MNPNTSSTDRQVAASADTQITSSSAPDAQTAISPAQAAVPDTQTTHSPDAQATPPQSPAAPQAAPPKKHGALSAAFSDYLCALRALRLSQDSTMLYNPTALDLWVSADRQPLCVPAGQTVRL